MGNWLLTDEEILQVLDVEREYTYRSTDGESRLTTIDCRNVVKSQMQKVRDRLDYEAVPHLNKQLREKLLIFVYEIEEELGKALDLDGTLP